MTGPLGNTEFCFPRISTLRFSRNKIHCSPRDQSLSVYYLIMQNTSNDTKHRYKLILRSILILECDFHFNFNLKLNNVTETTSFYT